MSYKAVNCGLCNFGLVRGVLVCQGCQGDVLYGATTHEKNEALKWGATAGAGVMALLIYGLPALLNSQFGTSISSGFGFGGYGLGLVAASGIAAGAYATHLVRTNNAHLVRTYRRRAIR